MEEPQVRVFEINEQATGTYHATLVGNDGVTPIPLADMLTFVLTLYVIQADGTDAIVNARNAQNVLNANNVTLHATSGLVTWAIQPEDTTLVEDVPFELHRALLEWTATGDVEGHQEVHLRVRNLHLVP